MNSNESDNQKTLDCIHCGYNANPVGAKRCQKCGKHLVISSIPTDNRIGKFDFAPYVFLLLIALVFLIFGWFGYYYGREYRMLTTSSNLNSSSDKSSSDSGSSDIRLYNSIKEVPKVPEGTFNYGGAVLFASITASGAHQAMTNAHPGFYLVYTEPAYGNPGNSRSVTMLLNGELSFAQIGLPLTDIEYSKAKERGFNLEQVPVAIDAIVAFTHRDLSIPGLSVDQLQDIYKGKITNWRQLGGPNLPIVPFARPKVATLLHVLLGPEVNQVSPRVQYIRDYTDAIRQVASTPGAISFGGSGPLVGQQMIRSLPLAKVDSQKYVQPFIDEGKRINAAAMKDGTYPMIRRLYIAIRRDGKIDEQAGVAYTNMLLSKEGQQFVEKAGFLPLR
ncbi:MAG: substrate-binding domain-containing protein [Stigonema ocellatum SAG 48.90 = DSM 106950]|nr:substrate-binding domain-containing protein [Stigonema ocellatum SAG 48.90 = DSM 106950]